MTLTFSAGDFSITVPLIPGSLRCSDAAVDAGGGIYPLIRTNLAQSGSCKVFLDSEDFKCSDAIQLISPCGHGNFHISEPVNCNSALLDLSISGNAVQVVEIFWKGMSDAEPLE